jgi:hypothetical protein
VCIKSLATGHQWLTPIILATQEAKIRRIAVRSQPGQIVPRDPILKTLHENRAGGVAQGEGHEFKPQYRKKRKEKKSLTNTCIVTILSQSDICFFLSGGGVLEFKLRASHLLGLCYASSPGIWF